MAIRVKRKMHSWLSAAAQRDALAEWERQGRPEPPPHAVKEAVLRDYAERYHLKVFVETGTYRGDMVAAMSGLFHKIYSIELGDRLYRAAQRRFRRERHIELVQGDSARELGPILARIDQPALFWLDGHYSAGDTARGNADTPIYAELDQIFRAPDLGHVIIIDDARCFGSDPAYPTIDALRAYVSSKRPHARFDIEADSIRIAPPEPRDVA
jgi:hypothetical protein